MLEVSPDKEIIFSNLVFPWVFQPFSKLEGASSLKFAWAAIGTGRPLKKWGWGSSPVIAGDQTAKRRANSEV
jgi:hypothetical protein